MTNERPATPAQKSWKARYRSRLEHHAESWRKDAAEEEDVHLRRVWEARASSFEYALEWFDDMSGE